MSMRLKVAIWSEDRKTISIPLTRGKFTVIDACDARFAELNWCAVNPKVGYSWYAVRGIPQADGTTKYEALHRQILGAKPGQEVDHINGDGLDNRRCNLRLCSRSQNRCNRKAFRNNSSGFKGVSPHRQIGSGRIRWQARIQTDSKQIYLGLFDTPEEAARVYQIAALKYHVEFAKW